MLCARVGRHSETKPKQRSGASESDAVDSVCSHALSPVYSYNSAPGTDLPHFLVSFVHNQLRSFWCDSRWSSDQFVSALSPNRITRVLQWMYMLALRLKFV